MKKYLAVFAVALLIAGCIAGAGCISSQQDNSQEISDELSYFYELNKIPRPSGELDQIQTYLLDFAQKNGLQAEKDATGNILIHHPGKTEKKVILQAHQDMVPAVEDGYTFDFSKDAITTYIDEDGWLHANHTSLGADDGCGIAIILSALASEDLADITFDGLFTVDEETSMAGAINLSPDWLQADYFINLDGEFFERSDISSAGLGTVTVTAVPETEPSTGTWYTLTVSNLLGGHSGIEIDSGRMNALRSVVDFLSSLHDVSIASFDSGTRLNAIPDKATVLFTASDDNLAELAAAFREKTVLPTDSDLKVTVTQADPPQKAYTKAFSKKLIDYIKSFENGVLEKDEYGVKTSLNTAVLNADATGVTLTCSIRSSVTETIEGLLDNLSQKAERAGFTAESSMSAAGWVADTSNELFTVFTDCYTELFGVEPELTSVHAGLECGHISAKNPNLPILECGPDIRNPHTVNEKVNLDTFAKVNDLVRLLLTRLTL